MKHLIFFLLIVVLSSCHKRCEEEMTEVIDTPADSILNWETFLGSGYYQDPIEFKDFIVWGVADFGSNKNTEIYSALHKETGEILWQSTPFGGVAAATYGVAGCDGHVIINHQTEIYSIDAQSGALIWRYSSPEESFFGPRMSVIGDQAYLTVVDVSTEPRTEYIVRMKPNSSNWDTLFTYKGRDGFKPRLEIPALWIDEKGDSILVLQDRTSRSSPTNESRVDILAINLEEGKTKWIIEDVSPTGNSSIYEPKIVDNDMILALDWWIINVDLSTGELNWIKEVGNAKNHLFTYQLKISNGRIYFNMEGDDSLVCMDVETGETLWSKSGRDIVGYAARGLKYHKGRLYKSAWRHFDQICAVSPGSGDLSWLYQCETPDALTSDKSFIIDKETDHMYISTGKSIIALKLPK